MALSLQRLLLSLLALLLTFAAAQSSNNASAVFVYNGQDNTEFVFGLNIDKSTGDIYFHLSSPSGNSWVGVGFGSKMQDAMIFVAYPAEDGDLVTISPRIGTAHTEPAYQSNINVLQVDGVQPNGNTVSGNDRGFSNIVADGVCRDCLKWDGGSIDLSNTAQPLTFAVGPPFPTIRSSSLSAGLSRHIFYGHFTMDMTAATSPSGGAVPVGPYVMKDATPATGTETDFDPAPQIHGMVMSFVFIILLPLGAVLLRVWNKIKGHIIAQTLGTVLFCMAFAGGCVVSTEYIRSKNFNSAHQIIGILLLLAMLSQLTLGFLNHRIYKREQRKTIMGKIHRYLGPVIILVGLINGALGFRLAGAAFLAFPYFIIILIIAVVFMCVRFGTRAYRRRKNASKGPEGYQFPQFGGPPPQYAPPNNAAPPGYPPAYGPEVPLTRFPSSNNVSQVDVSSQPQQPRPMV